MNLYLISQEENYHHDTYDAMIVCANSTDEARNITPDKDNCFPPKGISTWCSSPEHVTVEYLGIADKKITREIILSSFNAG